MMATLTLGNEPKSGGGWNLWDFYDLDRGRRLSCANVHTFFHYLLSPGTRAVGIEGLGTAPPYSVQARLTGPRADDGSPLFVRYRLSRAEVHRVLVPSDRHRLAKLLKQHRRSDRAAATEVAAVCDVLALYDVPAPPALVVGANARLKSSPETGRR